MNRKKLFRRRRFHRKQISRMGASAVEFAMIAPLMLMFTFGLVEVGRLMLVKQTATHASREGARVAVRPASATDDVVERVYEELALLAIENAVVETIPASIEDAEPGTQVTVRVRVNAASVAWVGDFFNFSDLEIIAESSMRRESTD
ncbi:TadE family protein [Rubripirellula reticaptiva]|uniref:TadE-like protein n=1 Tax=Rubripirellula reticaptiva TaxID=2528013 RepID=A0A5C6F3Q1_9BACT|nr:TadE family protein [Rubripirellula reticaptiva]TWU55772.1 TadE-like protein [Rubripirellula reticaptiva]